LLSLTAAETTVLIGGMRVLTGALTNRPETLTTDFFTNLLDPGTQWKVSSSGEHTYDGSDRATGKPTWTATAVDLVFGANAQLRAIAEVYAAADGQEQFVHDFVKAWDKVMTLDRFDLHR
ncbi:MAG: catalase-peroxidase, partial [Frankiaceae bacterium]|nr:catalase-peroxidase [Frankiaceae bacterium]